MDANQPYQALLPKPSTSATSRLAIPPLLTVGAASLATTSPPKKQSGPPRNTPWNPSNFELWVEHGVVWDLKQTTILGFIDHASIEQYFKPTQFQPNTSIFIGSPYSLRDFPVYGFMGAYYTALIFSALHMLPYITNAWGLFRAQGLTNGAPAPPAGAGPVASPKEMGLFLARSPSGTKSFSAHYVAYMWQLQPTLKPWWPPS
jgi:hypothetical protein